MDQHSPYHTKYVHDVGAKRLLETCTLTTDVRLERIAL